jgi:hypothetical protein
VCWSVLECGVKVRWRVCGEDERALVRHSPVLSGSGKLAYLGCGTRVKTGLELGKGANRERKENQILLSAPKVLGQPFIYHRHALIVPQLQQAVLNSFPLLHFLISFTDKKELETKTSIRGPWCPCPFAEPDNKTVTLLKRYLVRLIPPSVGILIGTFLLFTGEVSRYLHLLFRFLDQ